jgi:glycosyltransferase involved in cell wall biosynthesis
MPNKINVYQIGSRMHYAVPEIVHNLDLLDTFYTDIYASTSIKKIFKLLPSKFKVSGVKKLMARQPKINKDKIIHFPKLGFEIQRKARKCINIEDEYALYNWYNKAFQKACIISTTREPKILYSFNGASLELYQRYGKSFKILEQTIAPFSIEKQLLEPEYEKYGYLTKGVLNYSSPSLVEFENRELEEFLLSDKIVCASDFVSVGLQKLQVPKDKISVLPYGVNLDFFKFSGIRELEKNSKIKVLTVGRVGLRKGIQYIVEAAKKLKGHADFTVVGPIELSESGLKEVSKYVTIVSSVSKDELLEYYRKADVFLLPSLCEGSATVVYEALSMELPCIVTENSGTIIEDNKSGIIIPISNSESIVEAIEKIKNSEFYNELVLGARVKSKEGSIQAYNKRLNSFFTNLIV